MNEIINRFLLIGEQFMPETHLKQPGYNHSGCENIKKQEIQNIFTKMN